MKREALNLVGISALLLCTCPVYAQNYTAPAGAAPVVDQTGYTAGQAVTSAAGQVPGTVSSVGNAATGVVGGLQPTLQPVAQGVGGALNNLTQPDNISALLQFLSSVVPNHIEAHVNLDALRVEKLTVDVRGVDLRNLKVDLLVANSRNAGQVRPAMQTGSQSGSNTSGSNPSNFNQLGNASAGAGQPLTFSLPQNQTANQSAPANR